MPTAIRRHGLLALALLACVLLVVAEFTDLYSIHVITVTVKSATVGSHHGYALLVIALAGAAMAFGATAGGARPAALALLALGVVALLVALVVDLPVVDDTGLYGRDFDQARAQAEIGFKLETAGAVLLVVSAAAILVAGSRRAAARTLRPASRRTDVPAGEPT
jgi:hypothetical protein